MKPTLLGYLANFGSFSRQSEILCTQGLAYLLQNYEEARSALAEELRTRIGIEIGDSLTWRAEALQDDGARPDLEARNDDGIPIVKVEAKLEAELGAGQLQSYVVDLLARNSGETALLVLVPTGRTERMAEEVAITFGPTKSGLWRVTDEHLPGTVLISVITWDEIFDRLRDIKEERILLELEQLQAMYRVLSGDYIAPVASDEDLRNWRAHETNFVNMVDRVTRHLTKRDRTLPMLSEPLESGSQESYRMRYVCPEDGDVKACFSIGVRDSFAQWLTPIWMRFHRDTGDFGTVRQRIQASALRWLESGGHIWIPLDPLREVAGGTMIEDLIEQAEQVMQVVYLA